MTKYAFFSNDEGSSCDGHCLLLAPIQLLVNLKQPDQNHRHRRHRRRHLRRHRRRRRRRHCRHRYHHHHHHHHHHLKASLVTVKDRVRAL